MLGYRSVDKIKSKETYQDAEVIPRFEEMNIKAESAG